MKDGKFIRNKKFYTGIVYEWNLPAGHTCPFATECKTSVNRETGKFTKAKGYFSCYAARSERFPVVREHRWDNFNLVRNGGTPIIPKKAKHIRIHASGDFYSQEYFDMWLQIAKDNPCIRFWAFTKSIQFWLKRRDSIPRNFILTASYGGKYDDLIEKYNLKSARVYSSEQDIPKGMPIDTNDDYARIPNVCFALLDNNKVKKQKQNLIKDAI